MTFAAPAEDEASTALFRVCFVCSGNICRSPMAEVVFRDLAVAAGLGAAVESTSAGTGDWHVGEPADARTVAALAQHGHDGSHHRARQFDASWFDRLDLAIALDHSHERILGHLAQTPEQRAKIRLLLSFDPERGDELDVPDPYYSGEEMFDYVLKLVERASAGLFRQLEPALRHTTRETR